MLGEKNCRVTIIKKIDVRVEFGMCDCLRNNDIYYCGLSYCPKKCAIRREMYMIM